MTISPEVVPRRPNTEDLRRGRSSASLEKELAEAKARLTTLEADLGQLVAQGFDLSTHGLREQITEWERKRDEAELALPFALQREEAYRERQRQVPILEAELKLILAGRARLAVEQRRCQSALDRSAAAIRAFKREHDNRQVRISSELHDLGATSGLPGMLEQTRGVEALDQLADRWTQEANAVLKEDAA